MDFKNSTDFRHGRLVAYLKDGNNRYNYAEQGRSGGNCGRNVDRTDVFRL